MRRHRVNHDRCLGHSPLWVTAINIQQKKIPTYETPTHPDNYSIKADRVAAGVALTIVHDLLGAAALEQIDHLLLSEVATVCPLADLGDGSDHVPGQQRHLFGHGLLAPAAVVAGRARRAAARRTVEPLAKVLQHQRAPAVGDVLRVPQDVPQVGLVRPVGLRVLTRLCGNKQLLGVCCHVCWMFSPSQEGANPGTSTDIRLNPVAVRKLNKIQLNRMKNNIRHTHKPFFIVLSLACMQPIKDNVRAVYIL